MQFDDHAILYICHERDDGERPLVQAERVWIDPERPGRRARPFRARAPPRSPAPGSSTPRWCASPRAASRSPARPLLPNFVSIGTGYGIDADWRHGMYHGPEPVTQGLVLAVEEVEGSGPVRHRRPGGRVLLRRAHRLRPPRDRILRPLPPLRAARRGHGGAGGLTPRRTGCTARSPSGRHAKMRDARRLPRPPRTPAGRLRRRPARGRPGPARLGPRRLPGQRRHGRGQGRSGATHARWPRQVVAAADLGDVCSEVEVSGPGFINLTLSDDVRGPPGRCDCPPTRGSASPRARRPSGWSSTTRRPTWPRRCTSGTCAAR